MFQTNSWIEPLKLAEYISLNYNDVHFLYSGSSSSYSGNKSFLAFDLIHNFNEISEVRKYLKENPDDFLSGYLSYESTLENKNNKDVIDFPILYFSKLKYLLIFDHEKKSISFNCPKEIFDNVESFTEKNSRENLTLDNFNSNMNDQEYLDNVAKIREDIISGDYCQANLTRKYWGKYQEKKIDHFQIFKHLSQISPAPYSSFLKFANKAIISSSPERFINISPSGKINSRPIKGTGKKSDNNEKSRQDLLASSKDRAENLMIVDLMRNDLTLSAQIGTVKVDELFTIDSYATLNHMSSSISANKREDLENIDVILKAMPPGSMTGAPKIKVIETLREIEKLPRSIYSGAIGYFNGNKSCDFSVVIRTILFEENKFSYQVGGGIIYDSIAESELIETKIKDYAIRKVLNI